MQIKRPVAVVAIVTESFKKELIAELEASIEEVNNNQQALDSQARRYLLQLQSTDLTQSSAFRRQVEVEKAKMDQVKAERRPSWKPLRTWRSETNSAHGGIRGGPERRRQPVRPAGQGRDRRERRRDRGDSGE